MPKSKASMEGAGAKPFPPIMDSFHELEFNISTYVERWLEYCLGK